MRNLHLFILSLFFFSAYPKQTTVIVRAKAKDAKFIGSSTGGAQVVIRDTADNGILAQGKTSGNTGSTELDWKPKETLRGNTLSPQKNGSRDLKE